MMHHQDTIDTPKPQAVRVVVRIPFELYEVLWKKIEKRGLLAPEYIRHLLLNDLEREFKPQKKKKEETPDSDALFDLMPYE